MIPMIEVWIDGLCEPVNPGGICCYAFIIKEDRVTIAQDSGIIGSGLGMTNNVGEYTALVRALEKIRSLKLVENSIIVRSDSKLVAYGMGQVPSTGQSWKITTPDILPLLQRAKTLVKDLWIKFLLIPREFNKEANELARMAYASARPEDLSKFKIKQKEPEEKYFKF